MTSLAAINFAKINALLWKDAVGSPFNLYESLGALRIKTLIIHGDDDVVPAVTARRTHESIRDSKYVEIENCGHFPYVEQPDIYFESVNAFLR